MKNERLIHGRTCVFNCNYHVVFSTKYRRKVLTAEVEEYLRTVLLEIASEKGFSLHQAEVGDLDHVHLFVSAHPKVAPSYIVKMVKGISARKILLRFSGIRKKLWKGHLWNPSYYIETIGSISEEAIRQYIAKQKAPDDSY
jgi:putative transposase